MNLQTNGRADKTIIQICLAKPVYVKLNQQWRNCMKSAGFHQCHQNLLKSADLALFRPRASKSRGNSACFLKRVLFKMTKTMGSGIITGHVICIEALIVKKTKQCAVL
jgi:hypothetical protein